MRLHGFGQMVIGLPRECHRCCRIEGALDGADIRQDRKVDMSLRHRRDPRRAEIT